LNRDDKNKMTLLIFEFFDKIFGFIDNININILRRIIKIIFYLLLVISAFYIALLLFQQKFMIVGIILCIYLIGEISHYFRKKLEKYK
jgi:hypothetical protein